MGQLVAYHGKSSIKKKYVKRVKEHQKLDEIIQGKYWENGKGCAVGCTVELNSNAHEAMEKELGVPIDLAYLEDAIFEGLSNGRAKEFPLVFLEAITPGVDLSKITAQFMIWQFEDKKYGLKNIKEVKDDKELVGFCKEVVALYKRVMKDDVPSEDEFYQLYKKLARAGAWAWAGARAKAWAGAWARAWAWAGAWAWARDETPYWNAMADKLISLLKATK